VQDGDQIHTPLSNDQPCHYVSKYILGNAGKTDNDFHSNAQQRIASLRTAMAKLGKYETRLPVGWRSHPTGRRVSKSTKTSKS